MAGALTPRRRFVWLAALAAVVTVLHLWLADAAVDSRLGSGAADTRPRRIEIAFVRELTPAAPPQVAPARVPPRLRRPPPAAAERVASAPDPAASVLSTAPKPTPTPAPVPVPAAAPEPEPAAPLLADAAAPGTEGRAADVASAASSAAESGSAGPAGSAAASAPATFEWPPSTRLSYTLTGNVRGPVQGQARVEWLRSGTHYQVHVDVSVGPAFAPMLSRRLSSDGEISEQGLAPRRYDEETRIAFSEPRRLTLWFEETRVRLAGGREALRPPGTQDSASQFVQLSWLFTTRPELLEPGRSIDIPLALPRYVDTWTYDVLARETLITPIGPVETVHVKPRRQAKPGFELTAEVWIAPSLQYLPVRILIRQDAEYFVDLLITQLPLQAAPAAR